MSYQIKSKAIIHYQDNNNSARKYTKKEAKKLKIDNLQRAI